ncbi:MAG: type II toxin-antitoxin system RelE/ParE family toxin [Acidobacteriia bacterium]|nr:type II toxin-antitoxin system RelE/ParE family toxin [Terriglobia bacterium]
MAWTASFDPRALKELENLDRVAQKRVVAFLQTRILERGKPRGLGKPLTGDKGGLWRYRIGDFRLICRLDDEAQRITVLRVAHRKEAYR